MAERIVWTGGPSQAIAFTNVLFLVGLGFFAVTFIDFPVPLFLAFVPALLGFWNLLSVQHTEYELTTERLITHKGIFSKTIDELELYRVRDFQIKQPYYLRIQGLANIVLLTLDQTTPIIVIEGVPNARRLLDTIRQLVEQRRDIKGVRSVDFPA